MKTQPKFIYTILLLQFIVLFGYAQNLIVNPNFKDMNWCWYPAKNNSGIYFNGCKKKTPYTIENDTNTFHNLLEFTNKTFRNASANSAYFFNDGIGILIPSNDNFNFISYTFSTIPGTRARLQLVGSLIDSIDTRTFLQGKISTPLIQGCKYNFASKVKNFVAQSGSTNSLGVAFTADTFFFDNYKNLISAIPADFENPENIYFSKDSFTVFSGTYLAKGGEKYFTIGNYKINADSKIIPGFVAINGTWEYRSDLEITDLSLIPTESMNYPLNLGKDRLLCPGGILNVEADSGFTSYNWNTGDTNRIITISNPGTYIVKATYGCGFKMDTIKVRYYLPPKNIFEIGDKLLKCPDEIVNVKAKSGYSHYKWNNGQIGQELNTSDPGQFTAQAQTVDGCIVSDTIDVINYKEISPIDIGKDTTICARKSLLLSIVDKDQNTEVIWNNGSKENSISVSDPGIYSVRVFNKCFEGTDSIEVVLKDCSLLSIPNVFTPNNDGINDQFRIIADGPRQFKIKVYSRWGNVILQEENYQSNWSAEEVPDGLYFFEIEDVEYSKNYKGAIQIMR